MPLLLQATFNGTGATNWPSSWTAEPVTIPGMTPLTLTQTPGLTTAGANELLHFGSMIVSATQQPVTRGGNLRTDVDLNSAGYLTTYAPTGQRVASFQFMPRAPADATAALPSGMRNSVFSVGLTANSGSTASKKSLRFSAFIDAGTANPAGLQFAVEAIDYGLTLNPVILQTSSLGTVALGAQTPTVSVDVVIEQTAIGIVAHTSAVTTAMLTLTASALAGHLGIATPADLRTLTLFPHIHLMHRVATSTTGYAGATLDTFEVHDLVPASGFTTQWIFPPLASPSAMPKPVGISDAVLAAAATITQENDSSASVLSVQPTYALEIADTFTTAEHPYDAGYFGSMASVTRRRRTWTMSWKALSDADFLSLFSLSSAVNGAYSSFLWTDVETGEQVRCRFKQPLAYERKGPSLYSADGVAEEVLT